MRFILLLAILLLCSSANAQSPSPAALRIAHTSGIAITSTGTPSLNGTYSVDAGAQARIEAISLYIAVNNRFPAGQSVLPWPDQQGSIHNFPTPASFQDFATAVADYVVTVELVLSQPNPVFPTAATTIP